VEEREVKIETGYGLEGVLPDSVCGRILDRTVIPAFREGHFSGGLVLGTEAIAALIAKEKGLDLSSLGISEEAAKSANGNSDVPAVIFIALFILVFFIILPVTSRRRRGYFNYPGPGGGSGFGGGGFRGGGFGGGRSGGGGASRKF
jgi:uncharacterized protein